MAAPNKVWKDKPDTSTPINAAALMDLEQRVYTAAVADAVGSGGVVVSATEPTTVGAVWFKTNGLTPPSLIDIRLVTA